MVPEVGSPHLVELLSSSERAELDLTRAFYADYAETRLDLLDRLRQIDRPAHLVLPKVVGAFPSDEVAAVLD